jgi:hypothetical protein
MYVAFPSFFFKEKRKLNSGSPVAVWRESSEVISNADIDTGRALRRFELKWFSMLCIQSTG